VGQIDDLSEVCILSLTLVAKALLNEFFCLLPFPEEQGGHYQYQRNEEEEN